MSWCCGGRSGEGAQIYDPTPSEEDVNKTGDSVCSAMKIEERAGFDAQVLAMRGKMMSARLVGVRVVGVNSRRESGFPGTME